MPWQFLVLQNKSIPSVPHLLRGMLAQRQFGGLAVHWRVFGSSGHIDPPLGGVLQVSPLTQYFIFPILSNTTTTRTSTISRLHETSDWLQNC